jgi:GTP-binding protein YchF
VPPGFAADSATFAFQLLTFDLFIMSLKAGIIGLPNAGKSTIFNALTSARVPCSKYPFCTINPHTGMVQVNDERLFHLKKILGYETIIPATVEIVDIAGLVKGASKGEGLGNQFLANIREVDALIHVLRFFTASDVVHVEGENNPLRDAELVNLELVYADYASVEKKISMTDKKAMAGDKESKILSSVLHKLKEHLEAGKWANTLKFEDAEQKAFRELFLLTGKPVLYAANISEGDIVSYSEKSEYRKLMDFAKQSGSQVAAISGQLEMELTELPEKDRADFLAGYGLKQTMVFNLISGIFSVLNLISFFTTQSDMIQAWQIPKGTKAPQAAGKIHTDFEAGFITAEVYGIRELVESGSEAALKDRGKIRIEGRDYTVQDGDVIKFHFR